MSDRVQQVANAKVRQYEIYKGGELLGLTVPDSTNFNINPLYADLEADQIPGVLKSTLNGLPLTVTTSLLSVSAEALGTLLKGQVRVDTDGINSAVNFGIERKESQEFVEDLLMHPAGVPLSDRSGDFRIFTSYVKSDQLQFISSLTTYQNLTVEIVAQPDLSQPDYRVYGVYGDPALDQVTPIANYISMNRDAKVPYKSITGFDLPIGGVDRLNAIIVNGTDSTIDLLANGAISDTATTLTFDGLTSNNFLVAGSVLLSASSEYIYVSDVTYTDATSGSATIVRGIFGSTAASISDDESFDIYNDVAFTSGRDFVDWTSATPATATIGDTYAGTGAANKAVITALIAGSTDITFDYNAVTSNTVTITVA
jgi:hypothetical protein